MPKPPKPSALIFAKNIARLAKFYEEIVPMSVILTDEGHIVLDSETMQLVIHAIPKPIADSFTITEPPELRDDMPIKPCIPVAMIAVAREKARALGGDLHAPEQEWEAPGFRACDGYDPEGNVIQFRESAP
jgi:predicted enzyme related to lactoylglutathione lyase